jgi:hypothetical protein
MAVNTRRTVGPPQPGARGGAPLTGLLPLRYWLTVDNYLKRTGGADGIR